MIAFALALGFDGVVSLLMVWQILVTSVSRGSVQWDVFGVATLFLVLSLCMLGGLTWVARSRTAWQRRAVQAQWVLGGAWFGAVGVLHAVVGVGIAAVFII